METPTRNRTGKWLLALSLLAPAGALPARAAAPAGGVAPAGETAPGPDAQPPRRVPLSTDEALAAFETHPEVRIELAACEPQVIDPVDIAFDARGRLWVVEMRDYPTGPLEAGQWRGRIQVLQDRDADGFFETATTFADGLVFPTGLTPLGSGVLVTVEGQLVHLIDRDGDLVCDGGETLFTGFAEENQQLRANHPTWTLDARVHVASGLRGGSIVSASPRWPASAEPLSLALRDFEFSPFGQTFRTVAGNSQFGFFQDDAGQSYTCSNRNPCQLLLAEAPQVASNPLLPIAQWRVDVLPAAEDSQVFSLVDAWTTSNLHAGQFTAACGVYRYQSDLLAPLLADDFFACEPTASLVQRHRTTGQGIVPATARGREGVEFLASRDPWFRPVGLVDGPDGAIYVIDMHRAVIEHPQWVPDELKHREDERWGDAAGRIYRIVPRTSPSPVEDRDQKHPDLAADELQGRARDLFHANRWRRKTAARLLAESAHAAEPGARDRVITALKSALAEAPEGPARGVIAGMCLLGSFDALGADEWRIGLSHPDAAVRRQIARLLSEQSARTGTDIDAAIVIDVDTAWSALARDGDPRVRYQVLLERAPTATEMEVDLLAELAAPGEADSASDRDWIAGALSLTHERAVPGLLARLLQAEDNRGAEALEPLVRRCGWSGDLPSLGALLAAAATQQSDRWLDVYVAGRFERGQALDRQQANDLADSQWARFDSRVNAARTAAADETLPPQQRIAAIHWLSSDRSAESLRICAELLDSDEPSVYTTALEVLRSSNDRTIGEKLVSRLTHLGAGEAKLTLTSLVANPHWTDLLLDELAAGGLPRGWIDPAAEGQLRRHPNAEIRERATHLLASPGGEDRQELLARYVEELAGPADLEAGRDLFRQHCAACHRIDGVGSVVGPDVSDLRTQSYEQLLTAILTPNAAIDANYFRYSVLTQDGQIVEGLLRDRTADSVTLGLQNGVDRTIPADNIEEFRAAGVSLMPEGFESQLSPPAMRNLVHYLKEWRFMGGAIPGKGL